MPILDLDDVVRRARAKPAPFGTRIVAIDGPSGSGKSTLAHRLAQRVSGAVIVPIDDFTSWADPTGQTWWDRFEGQVIVPAFAGRSLRYQKRDWHNDEFGTGVSGWCDVAASPFVIVEGVTSARASVRQRGAFTIWVDAEPDVRLARGIARDGESHRQLWHEWMEVEADFFAADQTRANADVRVNGNPVIVHDPLTQVVTI